MGKSGGGSKSTGTGGTKGAFGTPSEARQKSAAYRAKQQQEARRRKIILGIILAAVIIGIGITVALVVLQSSEDDGGNGGEVVSPLGASDGGIIVGEDTAPVRMDIYQDYMCPACGQFEQQSGATVEEMVDGGEIHVYYHTISFLDRFSNGTRYSTRSAGSAGCASDAGVFSDYNRLLYDPENQPAENTPGLTDDELIAIGAEAGADSPDFATCVNDLKYEAWVGSVTDAAFDDGVQGTPTVRVNGQAVENIRPEGLREAVDAAAASGDDGSAPPEESAPPADE